MNRLYLNVPFREKDEAKRLGARFDWDVKRWYVREGTDPTFFARWLPPELAAGQGGAPAPVDLANVTAPATPSLAFDAARGLTTDAADTALAPTSTPSGALDAAQPAGISLSQLLRGVSDAVNQAWGGGAIWTLVEIVEARARGHVYLDVSERDEDGRPVAQARAIIWKSTAAKILPAFEKATGAVIGAGIKLLVLARPVFHVQYGFSLQIEAIDAQYTLGYLEARRREIRARLQREGVFEQNRALPAPWDFHAVLVIAPEQGAGLGDFRKEAQRLQDCGVCRFVYATSRFQGEGAAREIVTALETALQHFPPDAPPDAVVLIRGGGAVSDLAWLDDYDLARTICDLPIPVLTGIGHERDNSIPDEVAHTRYDTPSKVIAGIEQHIVQRTREAVAFVQTVFGQAHTILLDARVALDQQQARIQTRAQTRLQRAHEDSLRACRSIADLARVQLSDATRQVPRLLHDVQTRAQSHVGRATAQTDLNLQAVLNRSQAACREHGSALTVALRQVVERSAGTVQRARDDTQALLREIIGQGPDQTLARGFAIVRTAQDQVVTTADQVRQTGPDQPLTLEFKDGRVPVQTTSQTP